MGTRPGADVPFKGFPDFRSNVTFTPIQFFTLVIPHASRSTIRIVAFVLRQLLGWVDRDGNVTSSELRCSYQDFIEKAGVSRDGIAEAVQEAIDSRYIVPVETPAASEAGKPGRSGVYSLRWDMTGPLTHKPQEFQGFYYPPAALDPGPPGSTHPPRARIARMNVPNVFFDHVIPNERLSVIRVVGALLFYSIEWGPGGERKRLVTKTVTELSRLARLARSKTHEALMAARATGYIDQVHRGRYTPGPVPHSTGSTYRIRWCREDPTTPSAPRTRADAGVACPRRSRNGNLPKSRSPDPKKPRWDQSEIGDLSPVRKGGFDQSETKTPEQSEMGNTLILKEETNSVTTTTEAVAAEAALTPQPNSDSQPDSATVAIRCLQEAGFDALTAQRLAAQASVEVIQRQVEWLPLRKPSRNRLGLLRRSIEEDWARPEAPALAVDLYPGASVFTGHYYAAYHGFAGPAATVGFEADLLAVSQFLPRLLALDPDEQRLPQWGTRFGEFMRKRHQGDARARPNLSLNLVIYGDQLLQRVSAEVATRNKPQFATNRSAHEASHAEPYLDYLREQERRLQQEAASDYQAFLKKRATERNRRIQSRIEISASGIAILESENTRLFEFAAFFARHPRTPVLGFWEWDEQLNPAGLNRQPNQESHL
jgi:hypothetical protein